MNQNSTLPYRGDRRALESASPVEAVCFSEWSHICPCFYHPPNSPSHQDSPPKWRPFDVIGEDDRNSTPGHHSHNLPGRRRRNWRRWTSLAKRAAFCDFDSIARRYLLLLTVVLTLKCQNNYLVYYRDIVALKSFFFLIKELYFKLAV